MGFHSIYLTPENLYNKMWQCIFRNGAEFMWTSKSKSMVVFAWDLGHSWIRWVKNSSIFAVHIDLFAITIKIESAVNL